MKNDFEDEITRFERLEQEYWRVLKGYARSPEDMLWLHAILEAQERAELGDGQPQQ